MASAPEHVYDFSSGPELAHEPKYSVNHQEQPYAPQDRVNVQPDDPARGMRPDGRIERDARRKAQMCGFRPVTFWTICTLLAFLVVGATVGGSVGGSLATLDSRDKTSASVSIITTTPITSIASASVTATVGMTVSSASETNSIDSSSSSSTPTSSPGSSNLTPTIDCPGSNGTVYTGNNPYNGTTSVYSFLKVCGVGAGATMVLLLGAFVESFDLCIDMCSNYNYFMESAGDSSDGCTAAYFLVTGSPPTNCWGFNGTGTGPGNDIAGDDQAIALFVQ